MDSTRPPYPSQKHGWLRSLNAGPARLFHGGFFLCCCRYRVTQYTAHVTTYNMMSLRAECSRGSTCPAEEANNVVVILQLHNTAQVTDCSTQHTSERAQQASTTAKIKSRASSSPVLATSWNVYPLSCPTQPCYHLAAAQHNRLKMHDAGCSVMKVRKSR